MIHSSVPSKLVSGDTWRLLLDFGDYAAPTWIVTLYFENADDAFNSAGTPSGSAHSYTIAAATTAGYAAGHYKWFARATDGSVVETIAGADGWVEVLTNPGATGRHDWRSDAQQTLDAVTAYLKGRASDGQAAMTINGRSLSRIPIPELREWQAQLRTEVAKDQGGASKHRYIKVSLSDG